ncbi:MAG: carbohydrate binding family 9 domain-containing protein, partial [Gemmatimonadaceae bacterium]
MSLSTWLLAASLGVTADSVVYKKPNEIRIHVQRAGKAPVIDGRLDDDVWKLAQPLTRFVQYEPVDSVLPPTQSVGWVTYDSKHLYIAFRAYEPDRSKLRAAMHARERSVGPEDKVSIAIDTFNDSRRNYVFRVTSLGLQEDGVKTEGQGSTDNTPDFVWYSAAHIDDEGWTMEAAIPFASLRWPRKDTLTVGFDLVRWRGWTGALESWAPRRRGNPCDLCQKGALLGITGIDTRPTTDILPYVSASRAGVRRFGRDSVFVGGAWEAIQPPLSFDHESATSSVGADVRFALTTSTTVNATINPDFSQIEGDDEQVRVNQRFTIFNDERRPFFLEGRDVFTTVPRDDDGSVVGGTLFYSRAIVNPSGGARLTGKAGRTTLGALYARDADPGFYFFDGYESSGFLPQVGTRADVAVARLRRDVLSDSYFGLTVLGRRLDDGRSLVGNTDVSLRHRSLVLSGEAAWSDDRAPLDTLRSRHLDGQTLRGVSYRTRLAFSSRRLVAGLTTSGVSPDFRDQLGRFTRVGLQSYAARVEYTQYPNNSLLLRAQQQLDMSRTHAYGGGLLDWKVSPRLEMQLRRNTALNVSLSEELTTLFGEPLRTTTVSGDFRVNPTQQVSFGGALTAGEREIVDPNDPRVGDGVSGNVNLTLRPVPQSSLEV